MNKLLFLVRYMFYNVFCLFYKMNEYFGEA